MPVSSALAVSLDVSLRFLHRPDASSWFLEEQTTQAAGHQRSVNTARIWNLNGDLVAEMSQTGSLRPMRAHRLQSPAKL